ncbi:hypothetical protein GGX14DRAFT_511434 [Mycena pura]|uniref:SMP-30/Gluconolactonase/LRE-like region domain-containing protein n=1 Tax=Mycena pura TaxID=153505 RepID=A0AAD6YP52_9AGAR|nr:hypothetical protein GGX14DRAFT_511434 [Mycena pura]
MLRRTRFKLSRRLSSTSKTPLRLCKGVRYILLSNNILLVPVPKTSAAPFSVASSRWKVGPGQAGKVDAIHCLSFSLVSTPAMVKQIVVDRPLLEIGCTLGEGPLYDPDTSILHFVDIDERKGRKIIHLNTASLTYEIEQFDEKVACLASRQNGRGLAGAATQGFALFEGNSMKEYISRPLPAEYQPYTRFNDGACDSKGRFFAGTIYDKNRGVPGQLWKYDPADGSCTVADPGPFTVSARRQPQSILFATVNRMGMDWDGARTRKFCDFPLGQMSALLMAICSYFTDSRANLIFAYDYEDGSLTNRRVFVDAMALGLPENSYCDGLCVDLDGYVWSARWGGSKIIRFSPSGNIDLEVWFPTVLNVTSCAFGGVDNDQLYVTTAHCRASGEAERQTQYPDSGHLFVVDLSGKSGDKQYKGGPRHKFAG